MEQRQRLDGRASSRFPYRDHDVTAHSSEDNVRTTTVKIQKWGESLAVRLPSTVVRDMRLTPGQSIEVTCRGGVITMRPTPKKEPTVIDRITAVQQRMKDGASAVVGRMR